MTWRPDLGVLDMVGLLATVGWWAVMLDLTCVRLTGHPVRHWRDNWLDAHGL